MFLSRIMLDLCNPSARQALRDCNDMHRNLMKGFEAVQSNDAARRQAGVLYRVVERRAEISLLVSSAVVPDARVLAARGFILAPDSPKDVSALQAVLVQGRLLRFELLASPCRKVGGAGKNSRRVFLRTEQERENWLRRKAEQSGFEVLEASENHSPVSIDGQRGEMRVHYDGVGYAGLLRILDQELFWRSYCGGIGPGKAYGLGMLTVSRP